MDGVRVRLINDAYTGNIDMLFLERVNGKTLYILRPAPDGAWTREELPPDGSYDRRPSISFTELMGRDVLQSMAEQLAQLGFVQLNAAPQIGALQAHLDDMRVQAERLFTLASKEKI